MPMEGNGSSLAAGMQIRKYFEVGVIPTKHQTD